ncbi:MAG: hypothetical protein ACXWCP_22795 [Burkholderiales bacterium]
MALFAPESRANLVVLPQMDSEPLFECCAIRRRDAGRFDKHLVVALTGGAANQAGMSGVALARKGVGRIFIRRVDSHFRTFVGYPVPLVFGELRKALGDAFSSSFLVEQWGPNGRWLLRARQRHGCNDDRYKYAQQT